MYFILFVKKKFLIVKMFFCFFSSFSPLKNIYLFFFLFCYNFVSFYLFINNTIDGWAPHGPRQVFFTVRLFDRRHPNK
jgi:hypothetical protein